MQMYEDELFGSLPIMPQLEGRNTLKASLFTLIVIAQDQERISYAQNLVHLIAQKYPCKVLFIAIDTETKEKYLRHQMSQRTISEGKSCISCDVLMIETSLEEMHKVPFLIIPEISSDQPAFLLVAQEPSETALVTLLEPYVGRIVFDTPRVTNVGAFAHSILSLSHQAKYVDLNWAKTKPWRESLSRVFSTKERLSHLDLATRIDIRYSKNPNVSFERVSDAQALLLQAWLCSRLSWQLLSIKEEKDHIQITYTKDNQTFTVILSPTNNNIMDEGCITSIEIAGENDIHYLLSYERDDRHIAVHASTHDRCEMPYTLFVGSFQKGRALGNEIFQQTLSEQYLPTLKELATEPWQTNRPQG